MAVDITSFRAAFPEFGDVVKFPDPRVTFWLSFQDKMFDVGRWGDLLSHGVMLWVAHNLSLQAARARAATLGAAPGAASGLLSSKSVDKVSAGYDTSTAAEEGAGAYNLTVYGQQYIRMARLMGMGPVHFGNPTAEDLLRGSGAYAGPNLG